MISLSDTENLQKIIKIQSFVRGIEMRDKVKLKSKPRKLNPREMDDKKSESSHDNHNNSKMEDNEIIAKDYEQIIVNNIIK